LAGGKKKSPRPAPPTPPPPRDHVLDYLRFASLVARLVFWLLFTWIVVANIPEALEAVAGQQTSFDFNFAVSASLTIVTTGAAAGLYFRNRQLTRRIRELEGQRPGVAPQAEQLALPEDGGAS
jgi:hypothetical protein